MAIAKLNLRGRRTVACYAFFWSGWVLITWAVARDWRWWAASAGLSLWVHAAAAFYLLVRKGDRTPQE